MRAAVTILLASCLLLVAGAQVTPASPERVNLTAAGGQDSGYEFATADSSAEGRFIAFTTTGQLVPADTDTFNDIYIRDRVTRSVSLESVNASGIKAAGGSALITMTPDARFLVFRSDAANLVPGDTNNLSDLFVRDRETGVVTREDVGSGGIQLTEGLPFFAAISDDGHYLAFSIVVTISQPFTPTQNYVAYYLRDRATGTTTPLTGTPFGLRGPNDAVAPFTMSGDGSTLVFHSTRTDLVAGDTNKVSDLFFVSLPAGTLSRLVSTDGTELNNGFFFPLALTRDGGAVAFLTFATNLIAGATNSSGVYIYDRGANAYTRVSGTASVVKFSANGRLLAFDSDEGLLGGRAQRPDVFVFDRTTSAIERVSPVNPLTPSTSGGVVLRDLSGNGRFVVGATRDGFVADDTNGAPDVYLFERAGAAGCAVTLAPTLFAVGPAAGSRTFSVNADPSCNWTAVSDSSWLRITTTFNGSGSQLVGFEYESYVPTAGAPAVRTAAIFVNGSSIPLRQGSDVSAIPFGVVDTPANGATGLSGTVGITGWALDDAGIARIRIFRDPVGSEPAGAAIYIGDAVRVAGARPDVEAIFTNLYPYNAQAGWGYSLLTNVLPGQGNGLFTFYVFADDVEGHTVLLGQRTVSVDNAQAALPFGAIDTPGQGETVSGVITNWGWALTPQPANIPVDGSALDVLIDGVVVGHPTYGLNRPDITALFPDYANTNSAVGYFTIDTTMLTNGVHTIAWVVRDSLGRAQGIGSRYFTVQNP